MPTCLFFLRWRSKVDNKFMFSVPFMTHSHVLGLKYCLPSLDSWAQNGTNQKLHRHTYYGIYIYSSYDNMVILWFWLAFWLSHPVIHYFISYSHLVLRFCMITRFYPTFMTQNVWWRHMPSIIRELLIFLKSSLEVLCHPKELFSLSLIILILGQQIQMSIFGYKSLFQCEQVQNMSGLYHQMNIYQFPQSFLWLHSLYVALLV